MAMPWEMDWNQPEKEKSVDGPTDRMPWEQDWSAEQDAEPETVFSGSLLPFSKDENGEVSFDSNAGLLGGFKRAFMTPGDAMAGKFDPMSEEGIGRAFEFATTFSPAGARFASPKVADAVVPRSGFNPVKNRIIGGADEGAVIAQRVKDFTDIGVQPTTGMVSGSTRAAAKEQALASTGVGTNLQARMADAFTKQGDEFTRVVDGITTRNNPAAKTNTRQELGDMLREQAQAAKDAAFARSEGLYDDVGRLTGERAVSGDATKAFSKTLAETKKGLGKSETINRGPQLDQAIQQTKAIVEDMGKGMTFTKLKEARTAISQIANKPDADPALKAHLQGLRNAITADMEATARGAGENALQAFRKANNYYRRTVDTDTGFGKGSAVSTVLNKNTPEEIYGYVMGKSKEGGSRLNAVRRQIEKSDDGKAAWDNLTGSVVERMGLKTADDVSSYDPGTFLRNWKTMAPEAKDVLFKGTGRSQYRADLDRLARIADDMGRYNKQKNHSNTQTHKTMLEEANPFDKTSLLAAALGGPKAFVLAAGAKAGNFATKRYQAKMLADPETVRWLAGIPKAQVEKGGLRTHVGNLVDIARKTPDAATRTAVHEYLRSVGYEVQNDDNE
ncbi:hypothetical protein [Agrobacterium rosae]|uniref:hypothetical protein n=1 Tax=Agrobacterium rosae TaxID=1972867 RepID=UPI000CD9268C|nr:hypothetical protein [Agrobacterium rosae]POO56245.1 hypothetical protein CTT39_05785 [Agrobacterium rosae]